MQSYNRDFSAEISLSQPGCQDDGTMQKRTAMAASVHPIFGNRSNATRMHSSLYKTNTGRADWHNPMHLLNKEY